MENAEQTVSYLLQSFGNKNSGLELELAIYKAKVDELQQKLNEYESTAQADENKNDKGAK